MPPAVFDVASLVCLGSSTRFKVEGYVGYALGPRSPVFDGWFWTFVRKTNVWILVSSLLPTEPDSPRSPQGHDCSGAADGSCGQAAQRADRVLQRGDDFTEQRLQESRGRCGGRGGNVFVADAGNNAVKEMVDSNPPSLTFTQTAVGMRSQSLGNGYVRSCLFLFTNRENAPDRLQALLLLSVVAI